MRGQARERRELARETRLETALVACGGNVEARVDRLRARGELAAARTLLRATLVLEPGRQDLVTELATVLAAEGNHAEAIAELTALVARDPNDPLHRVELADAQVAAGRGADARATITAALAARPDVPEVLRAARALSVPLPLDEFRVDGRATIRAFEAAGSQYAAPAVMVLDRAVMRLFPGGTLMALTHQIVRVDSKDAVARWGEVAVPPGAEILTLRTHKRDGSTREPEEINGKEAISAADVAIGDYIEWEYLEARPPLPAFAPGFLTDRFFFQSFDAPMARSELVLVSPPGMTLELDRRAGAPDPQTRTAVDGTRVTTFLAVGVQQLFAERAAVPAIEYVPSVRASSGVGWQRWARYLAEELHDAVRSSPDVRARASKLAEAAPKDRRRAGRGDGRMGDRKRRGGRRADRSRRLRPGARAWQPHRADAGAGARARYPGACRAGAFAAHRGPRRGRCRRRSWTTSPTRWSSWTSGRRTARCSSIRACATRRSATCRPGSTAPAS